MPARVRLSSPIPSVLETAQLMGLSREQVRRLEELLEGNVDAQVQRKHVRKVAVVARIRRKLARKKI